MEELKKRCEEDSTEYLQELYEAIGDTHGEASYLLYKFIQNVLEGRENKTPPKPKGIDLVMSCGETHHIDTEQPTIQTVKVNGEQIYPPKDKTSDPKEEEKLEHVERRGAWDIKFYDDEFVVENKDHKHNSCDTRAQVRFRHRSNGWFSYKKNTNAPEIGV